jgi:hypothetical protein
MDIFHQNGKLLMVVIIILCAIFDLSVSNVSNTFATSPSVPLNNTTNTNNQTNSSQSIFNPWLALLISFITIAIITFFISKIIISGRKYYCTIKESINAEEYDDDDCDKDTPNYNQDMLYVEKLSFLTIISKLDFWDVIREGDYYPSLARFQFLLWTFAISFIFLSFYLMRVFEGQFENLSISSEGTLQLLGIMGAATIVANPGSRVKYDSSIIIKPPKPLPPLSTMLLEQGKLVLYRFQSFLWTFIGIGRNNSI